MKKLSIADLLKAGIALAGAGLVFQAVRLLLTRTEVDRDPKQRQPKLKITYSNKKSYGMTHVYNLACSKNKAFGVCIEYINVPPNALYSAKLEPGKVIGDIDINSQVEFKIQLAFGNEYPPTQIRVHFLEEYGVSYYQDYELLSDAITKLSNKPGTMYPAVNNLGSLQLAGIWTL